MISVLLSVVVASLVISSGSAASVPRGVDPANSHLYKGDKVAFACLDGTQILPAGRMNDNYCDCNDGSDEPGARTIARTLMISTSASGRTALTMSSSALAASRNE